MHGRRQALFGMAAAALLTACSGGSGTVTGTPPLTGVPTAPVPVTSSATAGSATPAAHRQHRKSHHHHSASPSPATTTSAPAAATTSPAAHRSSAPTHHSTSPSPKSSPKACATNSSSASVSMQDAASASQPYRFAPTSVSVRCGGSVQVSNQSTASHTFSPTNGGFHDTGNMNAHATRTVRFAFRGSYSFMCTYHPYMKGTVHVT